MERIHAMERELVFMPVIHAKVLAQYVCAVVRKFLVELLYLIVARRMLRAIPVEKVLPFSILSSSYPIILLVNGRIFS